MHDLAGADPRLRFSPYCWRIRMALAHKGLDVETIPWRFTDKKAIASSGQGRVPVLINEEKVISDSWEIALYLEETFPDRPALFGSADARGTALFLKRWTEAVLHPALVRLIIADIVKVLDPKDVDYFRESREKALGAKLEDYVADRKTHLEALRNVLLPLRLTVKDQAFLGGEAPSFADYIVFGALQWARCSSPQNLLPGDDPVAAWFDRVAGLYDGLAAKAPRAPAA